jgi:hypothetical protein
MPASAPSPTATTFAFVPVFGLAKQTINLASKPFKFYSKLIFGCFLFARSLLFTPLTQFALELLKLRPKLAYLLTLLIFAVLAIVWLLFAIDMKIGSQPIQFMSQFMDLVHERRFNRLFASEPPPAIEPILSPVSQSLQIMPEVLEFVPKVFVVPRLAFLRHR